MRAMTALRRGDKLTRAMTRLVRSIMRDAGALRLTMRAPARRSPARELPRRGRSDRCVRWQAARGARCRATAGFVGASFGVDRRRTGSPLPAPDDRNEAGLLGGRDSPVRTSP